MKSCFIKNETSTTNCDDNFFSLSFTRQFVTHRRNRMKRVFFSKENEHRFVMKRCVCDRVLSSFLTINKGRLTWTNQETLNFNIFNTQSFVDSILKKKARWNRMALVTRSLINRSMKKKYFSARQQLTNVAFASFFFHSKKNRCSTRNIKSKQTEENVFWSSKLDERVNTSLVLLEKSSSSVTDVIDSFSNKFHCSVKVEYSYSFSSACLSSPDQQISAQMQKSGSFPSVNLRLKTLLWHSTCLGRFIGHVLSQFSNRFFKNIFSNARWKFYCRVGNFE